MAQAKKEETETAKKKADKAQQKVEETVEQVKETVKAKVGDEHPVADKIKETLHESVDTLAEKAAAAEAQMRHAAQSGSEGFTTKQHELEAKWEGSAIKEYVTKNPIATAGFAFAAGLLVSAILKKK